MAPSAIPLDDRILTGILRDMKDLIVGEVVAIEKTGKSQEVFVGEVVKLQKPNAWVVHVAVKTYFKDGTHRWRWQFKTKAFRNAKKLSIHSIKGAQEARAKRAEARKAYAHHSKLFRQKREESEEWCTRLQTLAPTGIVVNFRMDDKNFKLLQRAVMLKYHPDRLVRAPQAEQEEGKKVIDILAMFSTYRERVQK